METFQIKTWCIFNPVDMDVSDIEWLKKNASTVDWQPEAYESAADVSGRTVYYKTKNARLKFTTLNPKQETLLKIKFGAAMVLESFVNCNIASISV